MPALNAAVFDSDVGSGSQHLNAAKVRWFRRRLKAWAQENFRDFPLTNKVRICASALLYIYTKSAKAQLRT